MIVNFSSFLDGTDEHAFNYVTLKEGIHEDDWQRDNDQSGRLYRLGADPELSNGTRRHLHWAHYTRACCLLVDDLIEQILQGVETLLLDENEVGKKIEPVTDRRKDQNGSNDWLGQRKNDLKEYPEIPRTIYLRRLFETRGDLREE